MTDSARARQVADDIIRSRSAKMVRDANSVDVEKWGIPEDSYLLRSPAAFRDDVIASFGDVACKGDKMPATKTHGLIQFRPSECSLWVGYKASYKSSFLNELVTYWACNGVNVALASFEMPAAKLVRLAVQQSLADPLPSIEMIDRSLERLSESMTIYDVMGRVPPRNMLAIMRYCAVELGVKHFVMDNMTALLPAGNDHTDKHQEFTNHCLSISRATGMHIHIVAHTGKPRDGDESVMPTGYSIRGTGSVPDAIDNILVVWRNRRKENLIDEGRAEPDVYEEPDVLVKVDKQKFWDFEGQLKYWINRKCLRFLQYGIEDAEAML